MTPRKLRAIALDLDRTPQDYLDLEAPMEEVK